MLVLRSADAVWMQGAEEIFQSARRWPGCCIQMAMRIRNTGMILLHLRPLRPALRPAMPCRPCGNPLSARWLGSSQVVLTLEEQLVLIAGGDTGAFRVLYDAASPRLFAIVLRILGDRAHAEDVLQEVFVRIWRRAGSYDPARGAPMAWLGRIARNAAFDALATRRNDDTIEAADRPELAVAPVDPPDARLGQCMKQLPADQARAITEAYTYGLSHGELALRLNAPLGTVKSWINRGMASLKRCMEH